GNSLLEVLLATVLFGIFTISIWSLFHRVYWAYWKTDQEVKLLEEGRMIVEFIQEEVRMAEAVIIEVDGATNVMESKEAIYQKPLKNMVFIKDRDDRSKPSNEDKLQLFASSEYKGYYLRYQKNVVAENIQSITISREKNSNLVKITCMMFGKEEGENLSTSLVISLEHKTLKTK
ncbi:MAG: hypothetical protein RSD26_11125, partial [Cellulosilyticaceae bacterium]